jgi:hypothetical protein
MIFRAALALDCDVVCSTTILVGQTESFGKG